MSLSTFTGLPTELLLRILQQLTKPELPTICRTSAQLRSVAAPLLYETIRLGVNFPEEWSCLRTLAFEGNSLGLHVRSLTLLDSRASFPQDLHEEFTELVVNSLLRMPNLREFTYNVCSLLVPEMCAAISAMGFLQRLSIGLPSTSQLASVDTHLVSSLTPHLPDLVYFEINESSARFPAVPHDYESLVGRIISQANQLLELRISQRVQFPLIPYFLSGDTTLPALRSLSCSSASLVNTVSSIQFPNVHTLTLVDWHPPSISPIEPQSFPNLEHFSGHSLLLKDLLSTPRPIRTLKLNGAYYDSSDRIGHEDLGITHAKWSDIEAVLPYLRNSSGPVRKLSFSTRTFVFSDLNTVAHYLTSLETLVIALWASPGNVSEEFLEYCVHGFDWSFDVM